MMKLTMIAQLNNEAVPYMQQGRFDLAISRLSEGVRSMQEDMDTATTTNSHEHLVQQEQLLLGPILNAPLQPQQPQQQQQQQSNFASSSRTDDDDRFYVYQNAYVLTLAPQQQQKLPDTVNCLSWSDRVRASSVLLYNVALAYHCQGLALRGDTAEATALLEKALRIYKMVPTFCSPEAAAAAAARDGDDPRFSLQFGLALWNNMANINYRLYRRRETAECCQELRNLLLCDDGSSGSSCAQQRLPPEDYFFFILNTLLLDASGTEPAPAA